MPLGNRARFGVKRDERVFCFAPKFLRLPFHPASIILSLQLICSSKSHINTPPPPPQCEADADGVLFHLFRSVPFKQESSDGVNYSVSEQERHLIWLLFCHRLGFAVLDHLDLWPLAILSEEGDAGEGENAGKHAYLNANQG